MQALLARDTFVKDCNNAGRTPLFVAVSLRFKDIVILLLETSANPHAEVHLSLSLAAEMKAEAIFKALEEHGVAFSPFRRQRADNRGGQRLLMSLSGGEAEQMGCTARLDFPQTAPASGPESRGYPLAEF
jgi:ankyrin repeat protein